MPLFGTLSTMPLADLLRWLGASEKTGTLKVERDRVSKCVLLQRGRIFGCTSNDPPEKLGHFLLSRGRVTEQQLSAALTAQETSSKYLGAMFVEMGVLTESELASHLQAQAAETIYGLFDWDEAVFRFGDDLEEQPKAFRVDLDVDEVVTRGLERAEEVRKIREVFPSRDVILRKTAMRLPDGALSNTTVRALHDAITGDRSLAELLLHVHGSEYLVTKFLYALHESGVIEVVTPVEVPAPAPAAEPVAAGAVGTSVEAAVESIVGTAFPSPAPVPAASAPVPPSASGSAAAEGPPPPGPAPGDIDLPAIDLDPAEPEMNPELLDIPDVFVESSDVEAADESPAFQMRKKLAAARKLTDDGQYEKALGILESLLRTHPDDESLRKLVAEAEASFVDKAYRHYVPAAKVPVLTRPLESLGAETLSPSEYFLLSRIDGTWDVKSIVQIAPLREVDVLITLKRLRESGVVEFKDCETL